MFQTSRRGISISSHGEAGVRYVPVHARATRHRCMRPGSSVSGGMDVGRASEYHHPHPKPSNCQYTATRALKYDVPLRKCVNRLDGDVRRSSTHLAPLTTDSIEVRAA